MSDHSRPGPATAAGYPGDADAERGDLLRMFDESSRRRFFSSVAGAMLGTPAEIIEHQLAHIAAAHPVWARGVRTALAENGASAPPGRAATVGRTAPSFPPFAGNAAPSRPIVRPPAGRAGTTPSRHG